MKKLFYLMMVAATALFASCNPDNGEGTGTGTGNNGGGNTEKPFYGFEMDEAEITYIGNDEFVIQMYILDEEGYTVRLMSAHTTIANVSEEGVFPEGTYELEAGSLVDEQYFTGSFYQNSEADYYMAITNGEIDIKHTAKGTRFTVYADGYNVDTQAAINDIECRYTGDLTIYGNKFTGVEAAAAYKGLYEGVPYWLLQVGLDDTTWFNIYVNTNSEDFEAGIPSGEYPFNFSFASGNADASYVSGGQYAGSMLVYTPDGENLYIAQLITGGSINITNNGDGTYVIDMPYYNQLYVPHVLTYEGEMELVDMSQTDEEEGGEDSFDFAQFTYLGAGSWYAQLVDMTKAVMLNLEVYCAEENTFADGVPAGTYTVAETCAPFTIGAGALDESNQYDGGSCVTDVEFTGLYDLILGGEMVIGENYATEVEFEGMMYNWSGSFTGDAVVVDGTAAAPAVAAKAPLKNSIKTLKLKNNFDKETTLPFNGVSLR